MRTVRTFAVCALLGAAAAPAMADGAYQNFKAAIYVPVNAIRQLQDPKLREQQYQRIAQQLRFDKVYLETYRGGQFADDASLEQLKIHIALTASSNDGRNPARGSGRPAGHFPVLLSIAPPGTMSPGISEWNGCALVFSRVPSRPPSRVMSTSSDT
jgi:hypothetical protein